MTEVRISSTGGKGLFATKAFDKGDLILEEVPIVIPLAPLSDEESKSLCETFLGHKNSPSSTQRSSSPEIVSLWNAIVPPKSILETGCGSSTATFRGMVQAGICWIHRKRTVAEFDETTFLQLYYPEQGSSSSLEQATVKLATEASNYVKDNMGKDASSEDWTVLERVMLIWAYNSFEGGRIYHQISRINHDCNPNAIIQADKDTQRVRAATNIAVGDEISISYLGLFLYSETGTRKDKLRSTKYFECQCQRCTNPDDIAGRIPCPSAHPRESPHQSLDEDVQYDDEQNVKYVTIGGSDKLKVVMKNVSSKVVSFLDSLGASTKPRELRNSRNEDGDVDDEEGEDSVLEEHLGLASTIMGDRHWTTNLLKLIHLDRRLSLISQAMLVNQEPPDVDEVAEAIDSLQRLERFVQSLQLHLENGHLLGDVTIGVARLLVSLGDLKSQKYGAEWLEKISDYINKFEAEGKQKVVAALKVAWKNHQESKEDHGPVAKKMKS